MESGWHQSGVQLCQLLWKAASFIGDIHLCVDSACDLCKATISLVKGGGEKKNQFHGKS